MTLNEVLAQIEPTGARYYAKEEDPTGDGWIIYIGIPAEMVIPFAIAHCIALHVSTLDNPELHAEEVKAVFRRFSSKSKKRPQRSV
jgi:hypothetical protein